MFVFVSIFTEIGGPAAAPVDSGFAPSFVARPGFASSSAVAFAAAGLISLPGFKSFTVPTSNGSTFGTFTSSPALSAFVLPGFSCLEKIDVAMELLRHRLRERRVRQRLQLRFSATSSGSSPTFCRSASVTV